MDGLPDFQAAPGDPPVLPPYGGSGAHAVLPEALAVADLSLELVRGADPDSPPAPYGVLELELTAESRLDEALAAVRASDPAATVARAAFDGGSLDLRALDPDAAADLDGAARIVPHGLDGARWVLPLSEAGGAMLRRALLDATLAVVATARLAVTGVSPRLPLAATPNIDGLRASIAELAQPDGSVDRDAVAGLMRGDPVTLPFAFTGDPRTVDREALAQALTDAALPLVASEDPLLPGLWRLTTPATDAVPAPLRLSEPRLTRRPIVLELDPLAAARVLVTSAGIEAVVHETVVPRLTLGMYELRATANLPSPRVGVLGMGVTVIAPPNPPSRPQAVTAGLELVEPADAATARFQVGTAEELRYRWTAYAVTRTAGRPRQLHGEENDGAGETLTLHEDDFPVRFVVVSAAARLLAEAGITGVLRWTFEGAPDELPFVLDAARPELAPVLPRAATGATLEITATSRADGRRLTLTGLPADDLALDLPSFPGYGPHAVEVTCAFANGAGDLALDLAPEAALDAPALLHLTRAEPTRRWAWLATSPFAPGYRHRLHPASGEAPQPWSDVHAPDEPLTVTA